MNRDMTTAAAAPVEAVSPPTEGRSVDAVAALGSALATFSSSVSRREVELARLFDQIVVERNALLETVLNRLWDGFTGVIPFDVLECSFLSDDGGQLVSYWRRSTTPALHTSWAASLDGSVFDATLAGRSPVVIDDLDLDWQLVGGFNQKVLQATTRIPYGETASYGEVAALAGSPGAARAAGTALSVNPIALIVPCHRIIKADGSTGGYGGGKAGTRLKQRLLDLEKN